jgi:CheY-like chemotaxis protein
MNSSILVADDDENDLRMIEMALKTGHAPPAVHYVRDGAEALDFLNTRSCFADGEGEVPAFLLLDLHMPRVDGWEVLKRVKGDERLRCLPVVVFSSSARESDVRQCYDLGANAYVVKPIDFVLFQEAIVAIRAFWIGCNHTLHTHPRKFHPRPSPSS